MVIAVGLRVHDHTAMHAPLPKAFGVVIHNVAAWLRDCPAAHVRVLQASGVRRVARTCMNGELLRVGVEQMGYAHAHMRARSTQLQHSARVGSGICSTVRCWPWCVMCQVSAICHISANSDARWPLRTIPLDHLGHHPRQAVQHPCPVTRPPHTRYNILEAVHGALALSILI
jgi:hypothetical protein